MAILKQGPIGVFNGKVGTIVISKWKNLFVGKGKPGKSSKPATKMQLEQRSKFALVGKFIRPLAKVISFGFEGTDGTTSMNEAMRYNVNNAISGVYPNYTLDYVKINLSDLNGRGIIDGAKEPLFTAAAQVTVKLSWKMEVVPKFDTQPTDVAYIVVYNTENRVTFVNTVLRSELGFETSLPGVFEGEVHGWIFFASEDGKFASRTEYLGKITLAD